MIETLLFWFSILILLIESVAFYYFFKIRHFGAEITLFLAALALVFLLRTALILSGIHNDLSGNEAYQFWDLIARPTIQASIMLFIGWRLLRLFETFAQNGKE